MSVGLSSLLDVWKQLPAGINLASRHSATDPGLNLDVESCKRWWVDGRVRVGLQLLRKHFGNFLLFSAWTFLREAFPWKIFSLSEGYLIGLRGPIGRFDWPWWGPWRSLAEDMPGLVILSLA